MALHKDLTGDELHEPKGVATATQGQVYVADGNGSGTWTNPSSTNYTLNRYQLTDTMPDISTANSSAWFSIPVKSRATRLTAILRGPITVANDTLSIYINGVLFADSLSVPFSGSTAGTRASALLNTSNSIPANAVVEVRSNGSSDTVAQAVIALELTAIA